MQSQRTLEGVHHRINIWAIHPGIQKSLLCWPPPPPSLAVAVATGLTKPELAEGIPVNPFLAHRALSYIRSPVYVARMPMTLLPKSHQKRQGGAVGRSGGFGGQRAWLNFWVNCVNLNTPVNL